MTQYLVVTQAPHYSYLNGGEDAAARQPFLRYTQRTPNGARIASAIAGMSPGDFVTVWADATGDIFRVRVPAGLNAGDTYNTLDWTPHGVWDATTEQVLLGGRRGLTKLTAYSDVTGDWRELQQPADLGRSVNGTVHYYGLIAKDGSGNVYFGNVESLGRTWQFNPVTEEYTRLPDTPTTNGGNGASLSWCTDTGRLARYAGDAQKWMTLEPGVDSSWTTHTTGVGHGLHAIVRYHATHARHLIVGGSFTSTRASLITSDGTVTNVTDVPDLISMASGSWVVEHPSGCWLVKTMNAGTNKVYACWPNAGLTDVIWVDLGTAPDTALTYPTLVPYTSSVALIASTTGLYAWALPAVTAPGTQATASLAIAIQQARSAAASAGIAIQAPHSATASASAAVLQVQAAQASLQAAVQQAQQATTSVSVAAQAAGATSASLQAAIQQARSATSSLNAYLQAGSSMVADVDLAVQQGRAATASASIAARVQQALAADLSLAARQARSAAASLSMSIQGATATTVTAGLNVAVQELLTAAVGVNMALQTMRTASAALSAYLIMRRTVSAAMSTAAQATRSGTAGLSLYVQGADVVQPLSAPPAKQRLQSSSRGANLQTSRRPVYRGGSR